MLSNVSQHSYGKLHHNKIQKTAFTVPRHLDGHKAIVLKCLRNQIKLTWTKTLLVAEGWKAGGVSGDWGFQLANCLDLINQSYWSIQMKTNGLGCLLWLPNKQQCVGRRHFSLRSSIKKLGISTDEWSAYAPILRVSRLVNCKVQSEWTY